MRRVNTERARSMTRRPQKRESEASEHEIQSAILDWLKYKHIFHWRNNTGAFAGEYKGKKRFVRFGPKGAPDIIAVVDGRTIGIEVKAAFGEWSDDQREFAKALLAAGGMYLLAYSLNDVTQILE